MKQIFDNYVATSFDGERQAEFKFAQFDANYRGYFPPADGVSVLDIGVGRGEMLSCMKRWGYKYLGVDISPSTVRFCRSRELECELTEDTIAWLNERPQAFDVVTCLDVLEHVPRDRTIDFLAAIKGAMAPGGLAIIQVPNLQSPFGYLHHFNDVTHVVGFVEHSLSQVLIAAGFKLFEFHGFEEVLGSSFKTKIRRALRALYRQAVRFARNINANPNPKILDPVLYAVVRA